MGAGTDETGYAGGDAPLIQRGSSFVLDKWNGGKDGVSDRRVKETDESISLVVGDWESDACRGEEDEWIWERDEWQTRLGNGDGHDLTAYQVRSAGSRKKRCIEPAARTVYAGRYQSIQVRGKRKE